VTSESTSPYLFGDLLALARLSWIGEMARRLETAGHPDYRRSDALVMRLLLRGPVPIGRLGRAAGVTRQAARKLVSGLEQRGYARLERDQRDARELNVVLTDRGVEYALAVADLVLRLNRELARRVDPAHLAAADSVLRAAITDPATLQRASRVPPPS